MSRFLLSTPIVNCCIRILYVSFSPFYCLKCVILRHTGHKVKLATHENSCVRIHLSPPVSATWWLWNVSNISPKLDLHFCDSFLFYTCCRRHCVLEINVDQLLTDSLPGNAASSPFISGFCNQGISCPPLIHPVHIVLHNSAAFSLSAIPLAICRLAQAVGYVRGGRNAKYHPYTQSVSHKTWSEETTFKI